ncbi:FMN-binding protein [Natronincola ferrireducens]|uniref:FMN-binding domain-containing protein n=1 Tax=Natronincola ferrireducens TaxID=393762 RepID=A0A1G9FB11_9FIRM|nr:FMN-binding protein [Natronincola ferrireducens]SDK85599.1 FMN-binding domain-containing protein [Natronincola ferrireducens]
MTKQQTIAIVILPLLAIAILFGGNIIFGGPDSEFYEGTAEGYGGTIRVRVEMAEEEIVSIQILEINDTPGLGDTAADKVIERIIEAQSTDVDVATGATMSSLGTINAVKNALGIEDEKAAEVFAPFIITVEDGEYEGVAKGFDGDIKVKAEVVDGKVTKIDLVEINDTEGLGDTAALKTLDKIIDTQSLEIDTVTGATASSKGVIDAVRAALQL